jgi:hypothetical protein
VLESDAPSVSSSPLSAYFSPDRVYRYSLTRDVAPLDGEGTVTFIGLNPSTADETQDDPTIRRCISFARRWGFARLKMLNLYAYRSTDPKGLRDPDDPVGPENLCTIAKVVGSSDLVICSWGACIAGQTWARDEVLPLIAAPHSLGLTQQGFPRHPLYVRADTPPQPFAHCPPEAIWRAA